MAICVCEPVCRGCGNAVTKCSCNVGADFRSRAHDFNCKVAHALERGSRGEPTAAQRRMYAAKVDRRFRHPKGPKRPHSVRVVRKGCPPQDPSRYADPEQMPDPPVDLTECGDVEPNPGPAKHIPKEIWVKMTPEQRKAHLDARAAEIAEERIGKHHVPKGRGKRTIPVNVQHKDGREERRRIRAERAKDGAGKAATLASAAVMDAVAAGIAPPEALSDEELGRMIRAAELAVVRPQEPEAGPCTIAQAEAIAKAAEQAPDSAAEQPQIVDDPLDPAALAKQRMAWRMFNILHDRVRPKTPPPFEVPEPPPPSEDDSDGEDDWAVPPISVLGPGETRDDLEDGTRLGADAVALALSIDGITFADVQVEHLGVYCRPDDRTIENRTSKQYKKGCVIGHAQFRTRREATTSVLARAAQSVESMALECLREERYGRGLGPIHAVADEEWCTKHILWCPALYSAVASLHPPGTDADYIRANVTAWCNRYPGLGIRATYNDAVIHGTAFMLLLMSRSTFDQQHMRLDLNSPLALGGMWAVRQALRHTLPYQVRPVIPMLSDIALHLSGSRPLCPNLLTLKVALTAARIVSWHRVSTFASSRWQWMVTHPTLSAAIILTLLGAGLLSAYVVTYRR